MDGSPVRKAYVALSSLGATLGNTVTDDSGNFKMSWASLAGDNSAKLTVYARMKDGGTEVFKVGQWNVNSNDAYSMAVTSTFLITDGTNCLPSGPNQAISPIKIGTTTTPSDIANIYDAAERMWRWSVTSSSSGGELPTIDIEYPADASCSSGCQTTGTKRIGIPNINSDAFLGPTRTAHEIGHLLSERIYPSNTPNWCLNYNRNSSPGWVLDSQEWTCAAWTEAISTFMSDVSRYWDDNGEVADTCSWFELQQCAYMLDDNPVCNGGEHRYPLSSIRFLWDAFDQRVDGPNSETNNESYEDLTAALSLFAPGTGERQRDEWTVSGTGNGPSNSSSDQGGTYDYWWLYHGPMLEPSYSNNCVPPGDR